MAPRPRWWHQLQASKGEARLAVDIYNRVSGERQLEAYIVHMMLAWLNALQARRERDGEDLFIRKRCRSLELTAGRRVLRSHLRDSSLHLEFASERQLRRRLGGVLAASN